MSCKCDNFSIRNINTFSKIDETSGSKKLINPTQYVVFLGYLSNVTCRCVLWWMILSGTALNYMLKASQNIVVAGIVKHPHKLPSQVQCKMWENETSAPLNYSINSTEHSEFTWNEYERGLMLGAYYWMHWFSEIPGGVLAKKYGTKIVFGVGMLCTTLLGFFLPIATKSHLYANITIRILQGITAGAAYPATHKLTAEWIPRNERSKFMTAYLGSTLGITLTYVMSGYLIHHLGWEAVYYVISSYGLLWLACWTYLVYDSPMQHPRISQEERKHILDNIDQSNQETKIKLIPWMKILTSLRVWVAIIGNWSCTWGFLTLLMQAPTYFASIHGWNIKQSGILAGLPHICMFVFAIIFGNICDYLLKRGSMTRTNVRKLMTTIATAGPGLMAIGLSFSGCYPYLAFFFLLGGMILLGGWSSGPLTNLLELSPNYASVLLGISGLVVDAAAFISPMIVGLLTFENQTIGQWKLIFFIFALNMIFGCVVFLIWSSAEEQPWNKRRSRRVSEETVEKMILNTH